MKRNQPRRQGRRAGSELGRMSEIVESWEVKVCKEDQHEVEAGVFKDD